MKALDFIILGLVAACAALAILHIVKRRGRGCCGDCSACNAACRHALGGQEPKK